MNSWAAALAIGVGLLLPSCSQAEPLDVEAAVFVVSLTSCTENEATRATAVSIGDGLALTVAHSFEAVADLTLTASDGSELPAELVYLDRVRDIALIAFDSTIGPIETLDIRDDTDDPVEDARIVVTRDSTRVITDVRIVRRSPVTFDGEGRREGIEIEGTIDRGDSGAPLIDDEGRIIGMVFASTRDNNAGWAIAGAELIDIEANAGDTISLRC